MNGWTAIVPMNLGRERKTRLAGRLSPGERQRMAEAMAAHVMAQLQGAAQIAQIAVLAPEPPSDLGLRWLCDEGRGLNRELAACMEPEPTLIIHADLPLLSVSDIAALLKAASLAGAAIAPDATGTGTNALALAAAVPTGFEPCFGEDSLLRHRALLPHAVVIERLGLACDVDTPDDLDRALAHGASCIAGGI